MTSSSQSSLVKRTARNDSHVQSACTSCRKKKAKCDGEHPCARCSASGKLCIYTVDEDGRTASGRACKRCKGYLAYIAELEAKIASLEGQLAAGVPARQPASSAESQTASPVGGDQEALFSSAPEMVFSVTQPNAELTDGFYPNLFGNDTQSLFANDAHFLGWMYDAHNAPYSGPVQPAESAFGDPTEPQNIFVHPDSQLFHGNPA